MPGEIEFFKELADRYKGALVKVRKVLDGFEVFKMHDSDLLNDHRAEALQQIHEILEEVKM